MLVLSKFELGRSYKINCTNEKINQNIKYVQF